MRVLWCSRIVGTGAYRLVPRLAAGLSVVWLLSGCTADGPTDALRFDELMGDYAGLPALDGYRARDGQQLGYRRYLATAEDAPVLLLLHGSGYHSRYLMPLGEVLSSGGAAHAYTPDLRGHGPSPLRRGDVDHIDQLEEDLADLIAHVRRQHPQSTLIVGGHSSGGGLALRFAGGAHADGSGVDGYLLLAPYLHHAAPTARADDRWARPKVARIIALSIADRLGITALHSAVVIEFNLPAAYRDGTETLAYSYRLNTGLAPRDHRADLAAIDVPLLVLVGADDDAFVAAAYPAVVKESAPSAEVVILPGVSHMGVAVGPEAAAEAARWLAALPKRP